MRRNIFRGLLIALLAVLGLAGWQAYTVFYGKPARVDTMAARQFVQYLVRDPETLTLLGFVDGSPLDRHSHRLTPVTQAAFDAEQKLVERFRRELSGYDRDALSADQAMTYDVWSWWLDSRIAVSEAFYTRPLGTSPYVVNQFGGSAAFSNLMAVHPLRNGKLARNYVRRLEAAEAMADDTVALFEAHAARGVMAPRSVLEQVVADLDAFLAPSPAEHPLVTGMAARLEEEAGFAAEEVQKHADRAAATLARHAYPGFRRLRDAVQAKIPEARTGNEVGLAALPGGAELYAAYVRMQTSSSASPEDIHRRGRRAMERFRRELDEGLRALGYEKGTVGERFEALNDASVYGVPDGEAGRQALVGIAQDLVDEASAKAPRFFASFPEGPVEVRAVPGYMTESQPSSYNPAAKDGSRPARFNLSVDEPRKMSPAGLGTLVVHETIPGHHYQIALQSQLGLPLLRENLPFSGYTEGWASYAELLAREIGIHEAAPEADIGALWVAYGTAAFLVAETGLHAKGWSREEAIAFFKRHTYASAERQERLAQMVDRLLVWPGQGLAYGVGSLKIQELRRRAEAALGPRFDLAAFHEEVLRDGAVPLDILETKIDRWIAEETGRVASLRPPRREHR